MNKTNTLKSLNRLPAALAVLAFSFGHLGAAGEIRNVSLKELENVPGLLATVSSQFGDSQHKCLNARSKDRTIEIFEGRPELPYRYAKSEANHALAIVIPGFTSGPHGFSGSSVAEIFCEKGISVVVLPSSFHRTFIQAAGTEAVPGPVSVDVADTIRAIVKIVGSLEQKAGRAFEKKYLAGASLGGLHVLAIEAELNRRAKRRAIRFDRVVSIHPATDLPESLAILDGFSATPLQWPEKERAAMVQDTLEQAYYLLSHPDAKPAGLDEARIKFLIGVSFHAGLEDAILTAGERIGAIEAGPLSSKRTRLMEKAAALSFSGYFEKFVLPSERARLGNPKIPADVIQRQSSLAAFAGSLRGDSEVRVFHSTDDPIGGARNWASLQALAKSLPGDQITVFDRGGHLGTFLSKTAREEFSRSIDGQ